RIRRAAVHVAGEARVLPRIARAGAHVVIRRPVADAARTRIRVRSGVDARDQLHARGGAAGLDVGRAGDRAVDLVADAGRHAAGSERQIRAEVVLTGAGGDAAIGVGGALGAGVAGAAVVVDLAGVGLEVVDRAEDGAHAARPARTGATRDADGHRAAVDDGRVVALAGPAAVEDAQLAGIPRELDE